VSVEHDPRHIVESVRKNEVERVKAIRFLVNDVDLKKKIISHVVQNNGDTVEGETIFHDTIVTFVKTVFTKSDFGLTVHLHGYLLGVARNLWLNALRKKKRHATVPLDSANDLEMEHGSMDLLLKGERGKIIQLVLDQMRKKCKEVLMYWASGFKMEEIAQKLGYKNSGVAKKKKSECMKELYAYLRNNPHIKERIRPV